MHQKKEMREGKIGSVLNLAGMNGIRKIQKVAVEEIWLHIPLIFGQAASPNEWK